MPAVLCYRWLRKTSAFMPNDKRILPYKGNSSLHCTSVIVSIYAMLYAILLFVCIRFRLQIRSNRLGHGL